MFAGGRQIVFGLLSAALVVSVQGNALALSPRPYFKGVERLAVYCARPTDAGLRDTLCECARDVLERLTGDPIAIGPKSLADPAAVTVLVNGHEVDGPDGRIYAVTLNLYRRGHVDERLIGAAPLLLGELRAVTVSEDFRTRLGAALAGLVVDPWRGSAPSKRSGKDG